MGWRTSRLCVACGRDIKWYHLGRTLAFTQGRRQFWVCRPRCHEIIGSIFELQDEELARFYGFSLR